MRIIFFFILFGSISIFAQSSVYYPLSKGNQWDFTNTGGPILLPDYSDVITGDTLMPNGFRYAIKTMVSVAGIILFHSYERFSNDTVYSYRDSVDQPIWDFFKRDTVITDIYKNKLVLAIDTFKFFGRPFKRWNKENSNSSGTFSGKYFADSGGYFGSYSVNIEYVSIFTMTAAIIDGVTYGSPHKITVGVNSSPRAKATKYKLSQNYPNPFNPLTTINVSLPRQSRVELKVFDLLGKVVATLVDKELSPGEYNFQFDGTSLPSGIYIYSIQAGEFRDSKKLLLIK